MTMTSGDKIQYWKLSATALNLGNMFNLNRQLAKTTKETALVTNKLCMGGKNRIPNIGLLNTTKGFSDFQKKVQLVPCVPNSQGANSRSYYDPWGTSIAKCGGPLVCKITPGALDTGPGGGVTQYLSGCMNPGGTCTCGYPDALDAAVRSGVVVSGLPAQGYTKALFNHAAEAKGITSATGKADLAKKGSLSLVLPNTTITAWSYLPSNAAGMAKAVNSSCMYSQPTYRVITVNAPCNAGQSISRSQTAAEGLCRARNSTIATQTDVSEYKTQNQNINWCGMDTKYYTVQDALVNDSTWGCPALFARGGTPGKFQRGFPANDCCCEGIWCKCNAGYMASPGGGTCVKIPTN